MTVLFHDVHLYADAKVFPSALDHFPNREVLYADDTLLLGNQEKDLNRCLDLIVKESKYYNLKLNKNKCKHPQIIVKTQQLKNRKHSSFFIFYLAKHPIIDNRIILTNKL